MLEFSVYLCESQRLTAMLKKHFAPNISLKIFAELQSLAAQGCVLDRKHPGKKRKKKKR